MQEIKNVKKIETPNLIIKIIYDNNLMEGNFQTDWGFSCLIEFDNINILFDTGENGQILLDNMKKLNVDPKDLNIIFLSHYHHDHTGGLKELLKINPNVKIYYPESFPKELTEIINNSGASFIPISNFLELSTNIYSLGVIDGIIPEQSLALRTPKGIIIITGCAHPGIIQIVERTKNMFPDELIYLVLGGFHLHRLDKNEIIGIITKMIKIGVQTVAPAHCTGNKASQMFKELFKTDYIEIGIGKIIQLD